jgi:hypothetical protein
MGQRSQEERERRGEKKKKTKNKPTTKEKNKTKGRRENEKKKALKKGEKRKKMRKERGYMGILNTLLPLYSSDGSNLGNLVFAGRRGLTKAGLVPREWGCGHLRGALAAPRDTACSLRSALCAWAQHSGAELAQVEKKEDKFPLFFPTRRRQFQ